MGRNVMGRLTAVFIIAIALAGCQSWQSRGGFYHGSIDGPVYAGLGSQALASATHRCLQSALERHCSQHVYGY